MNRRVASSEPEVPLFVERQRAVAVATLAFVVLNMGVASGMFLALYDFDPGAFGHPDAILGRDGGIASAWRIAAIVDMVSYLLFAPAVVYLHGRFLAIASEPATQAWAARLVAASGLGFVLVGAIGAVLMASVGPPLLEIAQTEPDAVRIGFVALVDAIAIGLWGTLELLLLGGWLVGLAWFTRREDRGLSIVTTVAAAGVVGYAAKAGLTGQLPLDQPGPPELLIIGAVGFLPVSAIWLAAKLWRQDPPSRRI
jgi:preprotein translocase subunit Sss1